MNIKITYLQADNYNLEQLIVYKDEERITEITTRKNIPDDNTIQRLGLSGAIAKIITTIDPAIKIEYVEVGDE